MDKIILDNKPQVFLRLVPLLFSQDISTEHSKSLNLASEGAHFLLRQEAEKLRRGVSRVMAPSTALVSRVARTISCPGGRQLSGSSQLGGIPHNAK